MNDNDKHTTKKKSFLKLPTYPGGKKAFKEFVSQNLIYPEEAIKKSVEGIVYAEYEVDNLGKLTDIKVKKGIGYGCDEETIRILSLMVYEPVRNRGLRVKSKMKARILFKLPVPTPSNDNSVESVNITYNTTKKKEKLKEPNKSYSYTINLGADHRPVEPDPKNTFRQSCQSR